LARVEPRQEGTIAGVVLRSLLFAFAGSELRPNCKPRRLLLQARKPYVLCGEQVGQQRQRFGLRGRGVLQGRQRLPVAPSHRPDHALEMCFHHVPPSSSNTPLQPTGTAMLVSRSFKSAPRPQQMNSVVRPVPLGKQSTTHGRAPAVPAPTITFRTGCCVTIV